MAYYQITNVGTEVHDTDSLTLNVGESTVMQVPKLPADLNDAIVAETLEVRRLAAGLGGGGEGDVSTQITEFNTNSALTATEICPFTASLLPPGRQIHNKTGGDIAIRCHDELPASFKPGEYDDIIGPGEFIYVAADNTSRITAIAETVGETILVRVFY